MHSMSELSAAMMSWVGCLLTDSTLPDKWKLREWEQQQKFWEGFGYFLQYKDKNSKQPTQYQVIL